MKNDYQPIKYNIIKKLKSTKKPSANDKIYLSHFVSYYSS